MNKTSQAAAKAFIEGKKIGVGKNRNTVVIIGGSGEVQLNLFGSTIARRNCRTQSPIILNDAGYQTNTTKDRLNTLLTLYGLDIWINQLNGVWWLQTRKGNLLEWKSNEDNYFDT